MVDTLNMLRKRSEARILCADLVDIRWKDKTGRGRKATAILEDISASGACVQLEAPIPVNTPIKIVHPKGHLLGHVRYCNYRDIGYFVGLQFVEDSKWSRKQYRPQHMLDMSRLLALTLRRAGRRLPKSTIQ
jgi:PilZ domain